MAHLRARNSRLCAVYLITCLVESLAGVCDYLKFALFGTAWLKDERLFERSLPPDFKSGSPNLIVCPKSDILNVVTYTYMFPQNNMTPLPQPDEVLLCTEDTSVEEVDIFLRRAFFSRQQKVFCMAYADYLDYDVEEKTEKKIQEYSRKSEVYHLVVICTKENEYKARIVAVLEKYRRPAPALSNKSTIQKFIHHCFSGLRKVHGMQSASALDPESLCVRVVKSQRSGVGKTLYKQRLVDQLLKCHPANSQSERSNLSVTIPLHTYRVQTQDVADILLKQTLETGDILPRIIHLDISYEVQEGVDHLLYNLLVLGCIKNKEGKVWLRSPMDLYLVEAMPLLDQKAQQKDKVLVHHILDILPSLTCWSPLDSLSIMKEPGRLHGYRANDRLFDDQEFRSEVFQRPFYYLHCMETKQQPTAFEFSFNHGDQKDCLSTLLRHCGVLNPSWSELHHFVQFLNKQLQDFENSVYCSMATSHDLPGFSLFVLRFLIQMSKDFATRSLKMSEESLSALVEPEDKETGIEQYELRRTWESSPHPYIFFNPDANSMTFLGFSIEPRTFNLMDQQTGQVLVPAIMNAALFHCLILNRVPLTENFDVLPRDDRLLRLYRVVGLHDEEIFDDDGIIDPDDTYELTTDNVKKMLAIYLRFRCNIPVVIMGETGCGKTRLVEFLCALQTPGKKASTMVKVKVHGGTTEKEIMEKVRQAERMAKRNASQFPHRPVYTVLFFDEANTTEAIGVIKEIMCDGTLSGRPITLDQNLKMVAACNPYRKHSDELIRRLENAGLGYHIDANKTTDKLGRVPMRRLVYRVQPLPQSMLPLVWDFGQLNTRIEDLYIHQMIRRFVRDGKLRDLDDNGINVLCRILIKCQEFMRKRQDECSFVSLRDVTRTLTVASWFLMSTDRAQQDAEDSNEDDDGGDDDEEVSDLTKALVLSLAVCYRACLDSKTEFDKHIVQYFLPPFVLNGDKQQQFFAIIDKCQNIFLKNVHLEENIARNKALKENVFMMVVCTELRIPLFLVGKPGSSKSLAKTVVEDAMQGISARTDFFRKLKQVKMVSFQCSPLATADGILATFSQCAQFQKGKKTDTFVSVVVLDEVGLAEDSPKMPLKTLHPLLEEGCPGGEDLPEDCRKVGFIGISNWALDPAKMNRGILVQRDVPDNQELEETARGICTTKDQSILVLVNPLIKDLAAAYRNIFEKAKKKREFFGLRDFYSLVKMVYSFAAQSGDRPSPNQLTAAIRRNFGGLDGIDPVDIFREQLPASLSPEKARPYDPDCSPAGLIKAALKGDNMDGESRYLLLLTENYGGLTILFDNLLANEQVVPIFGSSFPKDQEYTQICRNINRIKVCMEMGQTVILLNLDNLYESLYDALNQYYALFGGERYVDLGLGTHRVKCRVHLKFRLIVVAEKQVVYNIFPIPLINRLEKHFLTLNNILTEEQLKLTEELEKWAEGFAKEGNNVQQNNRSKQTEDSVGDVFMGYHPDTAAAIVLKVWNKLGVSEKPKAKAQCDQVLQDSKKQLLWCATPDAVVRAKQEEWSKVYNEEQQHKDLTQYLQEMLENGSNGAIMAQVTTHAKLLTEQERQNLCDHLPVASVTLLSLQSLDTEQQYRKQLETFFMNQDEDHKLLLVQSDCGDGHENLIKSAQYCIQDMRPSNSSQHHVVFIVQLPRVAGACFTGFLGGYWHCLHIDDLRTPEKPMPSLDLLQGSAPSRLLKPVGNAVWRSFVTCHNTTLMYFPDGQDGNVWWHEGQPAGDIQEMDLYHCNTSKQHSDPGIAEHEQSLDMTLIQDLLTSCLQAAVALVRDQGTSRATHRVTILLKLLDTSHEAERNLFLAGLSHMVSNIMEQKEQEMVQAKDWLLREAAQIESVKKAGTWRQSWRQCLERKVIPILAGIIAYLDTNNNLDLLYNDGGDTNNSWMQQLWLRIFVHQGIDHLNYRHLQYMYRKQELQEFAVHCECAGAALFSAILPFSWILIQLVENALSGASESEGNLATTDAVVEQSFICQCLKTVLSDLPDERQKVFELYISDLLHFSFALTSCQHEVLYQSIIAALAQSDVNLTQLELGAAFVRLNKTLHNSKSRLQNILEMSACQPSPFESFVTETSHLMKAEDEMTQDVTVLTLLVENLKPHPSQFKVEEERQKWVSNYNSIAPIITRIINEVNTNNTNIPETHDEEAEEVEQKGLGGTVCKLPYERKCIRQLREVNCMWTRASAVKLFLDFTEPLRKKQTKLQEALKKDVKYQLLWTLLDDDANLKTKKTLEGVDKFLKHANGHVIKRLLGKMTSCDYCDAKMESAPVKLPCSHIMCNSCWRLADNKRKCPQCHFIIPRDWKYGDNNDSKAQSELEIYQRQVSGFLMALVSQLCFAGQEPPEPEAVKHIFGYIIHKAKNTTLQTKQMMVVTDLIDPTPVLRSFLLRLLLRYKEADVMPNLEEYYKKSWELLKQQGTASNQKDSSSLLELSLLIMHCVEDLYQEQDAQARKALGDLNVEEEAVQVCHTLRSMQVSLGDPQVELSLIWLLGQLRFMLNKCTDFIQATLGGSRSPYLTSELKDILKAIMRLCQHTDNDWPKKFLIKQLCQKFGMQAYLKLSLLVKKEKLLDWFAVEETEVQEVSDRYLVCDRHYRAVRERLAELKVSRDQETSSTQLKQVLKNSRLAVNQQEQLLLLAVHREVSMTYIHQIPQQSRADMELAVSTFVKDCDVIQNKALAQQLCQNQLGAPGSPLYIQQGQDLAEQGLVCFLAHLLIVLCRHEQTSQLLLPLSSLIHQPGSMTNSFLPTMPQDNLDEVLKAVGETPELYHCPNGHRYLVGGEGQCKMPVVEAACNVCGARIGGVGHTPAHHNVRDQRQDQTQTGHILGAAQHRAGEALPERQLSPVECFILRFLTHAALYLGASNPVHATTIASMIQPRITQQEVCPYFWNHLEHDLQVLCRAIGRSPDEAYLLLHYLCHQLTRDSKVGARQVGANLLNSKEERLHWERMFADKFIMPVLQIVHETDVMTSRADNSLEHLPSSPAVWCYRPVITVEHFFRQFHLQIESQPATHTKYPATSLFRAESHVLRALHYVPAILRAQRRLLTQLCRRLDRAEAANLKIADFMKDKESKGLADLFQPFCNAWEIVKERLITYRCLTPMEGLVSLPQEFSNYVITKNSPLAVLLPSTRGPGLCAYILLYYLLVQHNEFLHRYCKLTKQRYESLPEVEGQAVMEGHLVGYAPEELLPLVLSHCNYSLKLGESTNLEYDFESFERLLIHSFMQCKSRVKRHDNGLVDIKTMVYTADTTSSRLFKQLREKINQESLSPGERRQIIEDLREDIRDISHTIDNLNITLRFLKAVHAQPETPLHKFMTDTLRMKTSVFSHKAQQLCCLKHIQSLWVVLCHQRASILSAHKEDAFDSDTSLQEELTEDQKKEVKDMCQAMSVERLELLLLHLFECIMLRLSEPVDQEDDVNPENFVLHDVLESNLEYPLYQVEPVEVRSQLLTSQHLSSFPVSLKGCHSKQTWLLCHSQLRAKRQQQH
ncbi:hypothetical protein C0Q70_11306 [Pomacea canaliculata]|uniref:Uncharacterized protein n=1 Tax=Pomacea canaliculata TaxID=400727 RepID=A0A2T7P5K2_POMCA|nr:hypothetical protein C0Q70_11306 [Pomacea canaliculata]